MTLPWYPRDMGKYARDTSHLTMLEHGAYNLMLDHYYSTGGLPQTSNATSNALPMLDHSRIYRLCSAINKQEQDAVDHVLKFFFVLKKDGFYAHSKADKVISEQEEKHQNRVNAGRRGGKAGGGHSGASNAQAMRKQCSSNTPQTKTKTKINPPTPQKGEAPPARSFDSRDEGKEKSFSMSNDITFDGLAKAKKEAPGWDIDKLMAIYDHGINSGRRDAPKDANAAFPAWCAKYTKGKMP